MSVDPYSVLEINPRASTEVAKAAYVALKKKYEDDEKKTKSLEDAKTIVLDTKKRKKYDKDNDPLKGKVIGDKYKLISTIATGGFGTTYKGEHIISGMPVCIKHAHNISLQDEEIIKAEACAIWELRHYGLPVMKDLLKLDDGSYALVMSYVEGPTLAEWIEKNGDMDPEGVAWITERILNTLKYLHFNGVVHGDVKPQNIIIEEEKHLITMVDFGLSMVKPDADSGNKGYTPLFASPEQLSGGVLVPESDFYSLGLTMIYCLGGEIKGLRVPSTTPKGIKDLIKRFIRRDVLSRPNWQDEDLVETMISIRKKEFGRAFSNMKPLIAIGAENE